MTRSVWGAEDLHEAKRNGNCLAVQPGGNIPMSKGQIFESTPGSRFLKSR
jgi:hypothetical protein